MGLTKNMTKTEPIANPNNTYYTYVYSLPSPIIAPSLS